MAPSRVHGASAFLRVQTTYAVPPSMTRSGGVRFVAVRSRCVMLRPSSTLASSLASAPGESCVPRISYLSGPPQPAKVRRIRAELNQRFIVGRIAPVSDAGQLLLCKLTSTLLRRLWPEPHRTSYES